VRAGGAPLGRGGADPGRSAVNYPAAFAELTAATARLLAAGPPEANEGPLPAAEAPRALAARDAVVSEVRALTGLLTGPSAGARGTPELAQLVDDPAHVLGDALRALPTFSPSRAAPTEMLGAGDAWAVAGRAAIALEARHDAVWELPGASAWSALRDVAELAGARLGWWTDAAGAVRPSHTAQLAAAATAHRRRLAGQRAAAEAAAGSAATPAQRREHQEHPHQRGHVHRREPPGSPHPLLQRPGGLAPAVPGGAGPRRRAANTRMLVSRNAVAAPADQPAAAAGATRHTTRSLERGVRPPVPQPLDVQVLLAEAGRLPVMAEASRPS
jgi:hypothetical protein